MECSVCGERAIFRCCRLVLCGRHLTVHRRKNHTQERSSNRERERDVRRDQIKSKSKPKPKPKPKSKSKPTSSTVPKKRGRSSDSGETDKATKKQRTRSDGSSSSSADLVMLGKIGNKVSQRFKQTNEFFFQSPPNAGGYNPRSQHGSLGKSHTIGTNASKTGLAISGHVAVIRRPDPNYMSALQEQTSTLLVPSYTTIRSNLREQYISLLRSASQELLDLVSAEIDCNRDNEYPCLLMSCQLDQDTIDAIGRGGNLSEKEEKAQDTFTTLVVCIFVHYATGLGLQASVRSSFAHPTLTAAPCATHLRISPGVLPPSDFPRVVQAIEMTWATKELITRDGGFIAVMSLRESAADKAKSAIYNIFQRKTNLKRSFYPGYPKPNGDIFVPYVKSNLTNIGRVIDWLNRKISPAPNIAADPERVASPEYLKMFCDYVATYKATHGVAKDVELRTLVANMQKISQARMLAFSQSHAGPDDVSDSEDEEAIPDLQITIYHKKSGALNGMHCVHLIMTAVCSLPIYKGKRLYLNYCVDKMYFETDEVFTAWAATYNRSATRNCAVRRKSDTPIYSTETEVKILFTDINHCNVSYSKQTDGLVEIDRSFLFRRTKKPVGFDYYVLDITSAKPSEIKAAIRKILEINPKAVVFSLSSLLKLSQAGADFYSQGEIRIFAPSSETLDVLHEAMRAGRKFPVHQGPRRFMKAVGGTLTFRDIFRSEPGSSDSMSTPSKRGASKPLKLNTGSWESVVVKKRQQQAELRYDAYIREQFHIVDNLGNGDCLYYAFLDCMLSQGGSRLDADERFDRALEIRKEAVSWASTLVAMGVGVDPLLFGADELDDEDLAEALGECSHRVDQYRIMAWEQVRQLHGIIGPLPVERGPESEAVVRELIQGSQEVVTMLAQISAEYTTRQSEAGTLAGHLEFLGLALGYGVNVVVHYVDSSYIGALNNYHKSSVYEYADLARRYLGRDETPSITTVHIIHVNDSHYVAGIPKL